MNQVKVLTTGEECQLHGAYLTPYKEIKNKVDKTKIDKVSR